MFHFNRKPKQQSDLQNQKFAEKEARREAIKAKQESEAKAKQAEERQQAYDAISESYVHCHNIAAYFNQRRRDLPGYEMSIRQKQMNGSNELARPVTVNAGTIEKIQESKNVFLEGHLRDLPGYEMSIRQKQMNGSNELARPVTVNAGTIEKIQESKNVFLEGHLRTPQGFVKDVYDSAYPQEILRERENAMGQVKRDVLRVDELEAYELARREALPKAGPTARVIAVDDIRDIPLKGAQREDDPSFQ